MASTSSSQPQSQKYSTEIWEAQKSLVERLYVKEGQTLKAVIAALSEESGVTASEKQLKSRITKWGFDVKNIKADTMIELARTKAKRALLNKESAFRVNKRPVEDHKMERFLKRKDISEEELLAMPSPENALSPVFSVFTPPDTTGSPIPSAQFSALTVSLAEPKFEPLFSPMSPISHPVQNTLELLPNGILQPRHSLLPLRKTWHFNNAPKQNYERDADDPELRYDLYWSCCSCFKHHGMTTLLVTHCPGCYRRRCGSCVIYHLHVENNEIATNFNL